MPSVDWDTWLGGFVVIGFMDMCTYEVAQNLFNNGLIDVVAVIAMTALLVWLSQFKHV